MKIRNLIITLIAVVPMMSLATTTQKVTLKGEKAEALIQSLLMSGFEGEMKEKSRSLKVDSLVTVQGSGRHECDDEDVTCGFNIPGGIQTAQQKGKDIEPTEEIQLFNTLNTTVDPILAAKGIENGDAAMGKSYSDYGSIKCSWTLSKGGPYLIQKATCTLEVPDYY
jgi:hypothetical protein